MCVFVGGHQVRRNRNSVNVGEIFRSVGLTRPSPRTNVADTERGLVVRQNENRMVGAGAFDNRGDEVDCAMASVVVTVTRCDKCTKPFDPDAGEGESVRLGLGKSWYDLDLCADDLARMMGRVKPWIDLGVREPRAYASNGKRGPRSKAANGAKAENGEPATPEFSG